MEEIRERLLYLHRVPPLTRRMIYKVMTYDESLLSFFSFTPSEISQLLKIPIKKANVIFTWLKDVDKLEAAINRDQKTCTILTIFDEQYPPLLKNIQDAPLVLYTLGDTSLSKHVPSISVIGTRNPSKTAPNKLLHIVGPLLQKNWLVVSGLAYGVDSLAHQLALQYNRKTISILGSGFDHIYPKRNIPLFKDIVRNGLVISEYPPNIAPKRYHFPERNRIISGISKATLVIEATEKSGTLITVEQALDQGKEVYAVPGSPYIPQTVGCHKMIQDGAKLVMCANDVLEDW
ncbi:DNA-processing protein DprA [Pseudogracilibacillus sp. SE30717A]|uniref:DNA-processing protein DprA n=1 Tax=Pseudogracilibacillus sp. SE30717A TaxID=3098293 RepID=UPI00300E3972